MRRSRPSVLALLAYVALVPLLASPACSDEVPNAPGVAPDAGADGPAPPDAATQPEGSGGSGMGGSGAVDAAASGGASDARAGTANGGAASGGKGPVSGGTGGTGGSSGTCELVGSQDGSEPEPLALCARLQSASVLSFDVTRAYDHAVFDDCRVAWVIDLYLAVRKRPDFLNTLLAWNMNLWGCTPPAPEDFALIFEPAPLTAGDAAALIDVYLEVVTLALELSPAEIAEMRAALGHLARPLIADRSCELSKSRCIVDAGADGSTAAGGSNAGGATGGSGGATGGSGGAAGAGSGGEPAGTGGSTGEGGSSNPDGDASSPADAALDASRSTDASTGGTAN